MSVMAMAPERSLAQRLDALERANDVRSRRRELKAGVRAEASRALVVLREPGPEAETMKVWDLLLALPKVGRVKANKMLSVAKVSPSKTVGGLTDRQRRELLEVVRRYAPTLRRSV